MQVADTQKKKVPEGSSRSINLPQSMGLVIEQILLEVVSKHVNVQWGHWEPPAQIYEGQINPCDQPHHFLWQGDHAVGKGQAVGAVHLGFSRDSSTVSHNVLIMKSVR